MRTHLLKLVALSVVGLMVAQGVAADEAKKGRKKREGAAARKQKAKGGEGAQRGKARQEQLIKELKLTDKQDAPVRQILETFWADMGNWQRENGPTLRELQKTLGSSRGQGRQGKGKKPPADASEPKAKPDEIEAARAKLAELTKQRREKIGNVLAQLKEHLTDEQMAVVRKSLGGGQRPQGAQGMAALKRLELDKDQQAKVREIMKAARESGDGNDKAARGKAMRQAWKKIVEEVLTDAQREQLKQLKKDGPPRREGGQRQRSKRAGGEGGKERKKERGGEEG
jgi:Spy/CpxP family protein refolding chaperone